MIFTRTSNSAALRPPASAAPAVARSFSVSSLFWLGLVFSYIAFLLAASSRLSNSWIEDSTEDSYKTIRKKSQPGDWTCDTLAVIFSFTGVLLLFPYLKLVKGRENSSQPLEPPQLIGLPISKAFAILCVLNGCVLAFATCAAYARTPDALTSLEHSEGLIYGASYLLLRWSSLFGGLSVFCLLSHELLEYYQLRQSRWPEVSSKAAVAFARYAQRSRLGLHQRKFIHFLFLTITLMFTGSWFYSYMEGWNMRLSLLFVAILLSTIGSSPFIPSLIPTQAFTMFFFPIGAAIALFTLQLCWKHILVAFIRLFPWLGGSRLRSDDHRGELRLTGIFALCWLLMGSIVFSWTEGWQAWDSLWFSFATLVTIGFGDFFPQRPTSSLFLFLFVFVGFGSVSSIMQSLARLYAGKIRQEKIERDERKRARNERKSQRNSLNRLNPQGNKTIEAISPSAIDTLTSEENLLNPPLSPALPGISVDLPENLDYCEVSYQFHQLNSEILKCLPVESLAQWNFHGRLYEKWINEKMKENLSSSVSSLLATGEGHEEVYSLNKFLNGEDEKIHQDEEESDAEDLQGAAAADDDDEEDSDSYTPEEEEAGGIPLSDITTTSGSSLLFTAGWPKSQAISGRGGLARGK